MHSHRAAPRRMHIHRYVPDGSADAATTASRRREKERAGSQAAWGDADDESSSYLLPALPQSQTLSEYEREIIKPDLTPDLNPNLNP